MAPWGPGLEPGGVVFGMLESLRQLGECDRDVLIGVVDGIPDLDCQALRDANLSIAQSMIPEGAGTPNSHGTEICSLIFGRPPKALGIAQGCSGLSLPIFFTDDDQAEVLPASQMDLARALTLAVEHRVSIVNISAGQKASTPEAGRHLEDALALCERHRILVIAAAGNDGCECLHVPAAVPTALAVGAMDEAGEPLKASNWGDSYAKNGLLAPGVNLDVVGPGDQARRRTGTSYATAVVSGVAARLLSAARRSGTEMDALDVRSILFESSDSCDPGADSDCARVLAGKLNIDNAIRLLSERSRTTQSAFLFRPSEQRTLTREIVQMGEKDQTVGAAAQLALSNSDGVRESALEVLGQVDQQACSCGGDEAPDKSDGVEAAELRASSPVGDDTARALAMPVQQQSRAETEAMGNVAPSSTGPSSSPLLTQQACACGGDQPPQLAYTLGALWFDFGSDARYDAIVQRMNDPVAANTPSALFAFLGDHLDSASGITFILMQDQIPIYAVVPSGPFALDIYRAMLDALNASLKSAGTMQRVAIPGFISGTTRLMNGMVLPVLYPDLRGMTMWQSPALVKSAATAAGAEKVDEDHILNFLNRVYDELRNLGMAPEERAINCAATNAFQVARAFTDAVNRKLELYSIRVSKSPICRPESDCWDVQLLMFDPENDRRAGRIYRFTIDVSDVIPVTVGPMRSWAAPLVGM